LRVHWEEKGDRLFAPVVFPSKVTDRGHSKLQQPHLTLRFAQFILHIIPSPLPPRAPLPPAHKSNSFTHNNGLNTSTNVAPRAYTPVSYAWSPARQLRTILSTPIEARHRAEQSLRIFKL
jgi:hypothetical protein